MTLHLSHSKLSTYRSCQKKFEHKYVNKVYPRTRPTYFAVGSAVHAFLERWYSLRGASFQVCYKAAEEEMKKVDTGLMTAYAQKNFEADKALVAAICQEYARRYTSDFTQWKNMLLESDLSKDNGLILSDGITYGGFIDGLVQDQDGKWWILETKTTGRFDQNMLSRVPFESQVMGYMQLAKDKVIGEYPSGVIYNIILKSRLKQQHSKGETFESFVQRIAQQYLEKGDEKFIRHVVPIDDHARIREWRVDTHYTAREIKQKLDKNSQVWPKNTSACIDYSGCEYMDACRDCEYSVVKYDVPTPSVEALKK